MSECPYIHRVDAYHDDAMDHRVEADRTAAHLLTCPACAERLRQIREIGNVVASFPSGPMPPMAKERLRQAVAEAVDRGPTRFAWELTGLAASVLIAASVWLATLPATASAESDAGKWEQVAATGGRSLTTSDTRTATTADARFASWVVSGLADDSATSQQESRP